ncbi:hypothetical protein Tco_0233664, partial [Tanacetum coccineum]
MRADMSIMQEELGAPLQPETPRMILKEHLEQHCSAFSLKLLEYNLRVVGEEGGGEGGAVEEEGGEGGRWWRRRGGALGWLLKETHVTWAHLEKKRTRLQLYSKSDKENSYTVAGDGVTIFREGVRISR